MSKYFNRHILLYWPRGNCVPLCANERRIFHEKFYTILSTQLQSFCSFFLFFFLIKDSFKNHLISSSAMKFKQTKSKIDVEFQSFSTIDNFIRASIQLQKRFSLIFHFDLPSKQLLTKPLTFPFSKTSLNNHLLDCTIKNAIKLGQVRSKMSLKWSQFHFEIHMYVCLSEKKKKKKKERKS